jgi:D-sedoheptulose 7-phosphate isomerase
LWVGASSVRAPPQRAGWKSRRMDDLIRNEILASAAVLRALGEDSTFCSAVRSVAELAVATLRGRNKILICGNGGSAADAQHWAGELVSRFNYDRPGLAAVALTTDTSILTAIGNDFGYERVFARQIEAIGVTGDLLLAISTSGRSPNVLAALHAAHARGLTTVGLTGANGSEMASLCEVCLTVPSTLTPRIQECHEVIGHTICMLIERQMFPRNA